MLRQPLLKGPIRADLNIVSGASVEYHLSVGRKPAGSDVLFPASRRRCWRSVRNARRAIDVRVSAGGRASNSIRLTFRPVITGIAGDGSRTDC